MENFIIVLISIGALVYNIYKNYQKEMEKNKSRRPNVRPQPIPVEVSKPDVKKVKHKEVSYHTEIPAEVLAAQERRRMKNIQKPVPMQKRQEVEEKHTYHEFDLRNAIIQSAILERPYK